MNQDMGPWIGKTGFPYVFHVFPRGESVPPRQGLFVYAKKDEAGAWRPVYMGQGDLSVCCADPDLLACIDAKGATHVHMRLCPSPDERAAELADLLAQYRNAYAPHGCNVPEPGMDAVDPSSPAEATGAAGAAGGSEPLAAV